MMTFRKFGLRRTESVMISRQEFSNPFEGGSNRYFDRKLAIRGNNLEENTSPVTSEHDGI